MTRSSALLPLFLAGCFVDPGMHMSEDEESGSGSSEESGWESDGSGGSSSGASGESGSGSESGEESSGFIADSSSGETGTEDPIYTPCEDDVDCDGGFCISGDLGSFCSADCADGNLATDCPISDAGTVVCTYYGPSLGCMLSCASGEECPEGTVCVDVLMTAKGELMRVCAG